MMRAVRHIGEIDRIRCRHAFEKRFTAERMTKEYVQLYEQMIQEAALSKVAHSDE